MVKKLKIGTDFSGIEAPIIALFWAVNNGNIEVIELLLENEADINLQDKDGNTPLISAVYKNKNIEVIKLLLKHGANPHILNDLDNNALDIACVRGNTKLIKLLIETGLNCDDKECMLANDKYSELYNNNLPCNRCLDAKTIEELEELDCDGCYDYYVQNDKYDIGMREFNKLRNHNRVLKDMYWAELGSPVNTASSTRSRVQTRSGSGALVRTTTRSPVQKLSLPVTTAVQASKLTSTLAESDSTIASGIWNRVLKDMYWDHDTKAWIKRPPNVSFTPRKYHASVLRKTKHDYEDDVLYRVLLKPSIELNRALTGDIGEREDRESFAKRRFNLLRR